MPTATKSIRLKCLDCCVGSSYEVKLCAAKQCPIWPYRFGMRPETAARKYGAEAVATGS